MSPDRKPLLMTTPALLVLLCFFVLPMSYFFVVSFWQLKMYQLVPDATLENYIEVYEQYFHAGLFTLGIALLIATITTFLAFMIAYMIWGRDWGRVYAGPFFAQGGGVVLGRRLLCGQRKTPQPGPG